jgi:SAM-dependent methyltransferase
VSDTAPPGLTAGDRPTHHLPVNLANWESRVPLHVAGYGIEAYRDEPAHLSDVVRFDVPRLGDIAGLDVVHLQCHIGTDTLSLHRLGARVTGLDFSPSALEAAQRLAAECGADIDYVQAELYGAVEALGAGRFDLVYTGVGALCWLPDVAGWARVVAALLRPGGRLFIREGHPVLWSLDDPREDRLLVVRFPYFEVPEGTRFSEDHTYVEHDEPLGSPDIVCYNHGLGEIVQAVLDAGLSLDRLEEHRSVPWNPLGDQMVLGEDGEWRLREGSERLPLTYTLAATKGRPPTGS